MNENSKHLIPCLHEDDIQRWKKIIDGNGEKALIVRLNQMEMDTNTAIQIAKDNVTAINGVQRFMDGIQTRDELIEKMERKEREEKKWRIGTYIAAFGLLVTFGALVITIIEKLPK